MKYLWGVVHALRVNLLLITTFSLWLWRWLSVLSEVAAAATADHHHVHSCLGPGFNQHASRWENGGFLSHRGTPNSWMVYRFISWKIDRKNGWFGDPPFLGNLQWWKWWWTTRIWCILIGKMMMNCMDFVFLLQLGQLDPHACGAHAHTCL